MNWNLFPEYDERKKELWLKKHYLDPNYKPNPGDNPNTGFGMTIKEFREKFFNIKKFL